MTQLSLPLKRLDNYTMHMDRSVRSSRMVNRRDSLYEGTRLGKKQMLEKMACSSRNSGSEFGIIPHVGVVSGSNILQ
jgi:hypothetical protein